MSKRFRITEKEKEIMAHVIAAAAILFMCLHNIFDMDYPVVNGDAFGYWSNAVSFCGYDWTGLISRNSYYSWGYSLWLVPIVKLLPHALWYKAAILLNALFLVASYVLAFKTAKLLFPKTEHILLGLVAFVVIIYPGNLLYAQETWTETLLYMLMWLVTYLVVSMDRKFSYPRFFLMQILLGYMYMVHARSIGIVLAGMIVSALLLLKHKKSIWLYISVVAIFGVLYFANKELKDFVISNYYNNSESSKVNNVGLDKTTLGFYFTRMTSDIKKLLESLLGKGAYFLMMSGFSVIPAVYMCIVKIHELIKRQKDEMSISNIWCVLAFLAALALCALQMMEWQSRKDIIVYSRYFENACGPVLLLGIIYMIESPPRVRLAAVAGWLLSLSGMLFAVYCVKDADRYFNTMCSPSFGALYDNARNSEMLLRMVVAVENAFILGIIASIVLKHRKHAAGLILSLFASVYIIVFVSGSGYLPAYRAELNRRLVPMNIAIEADSDKKIYFYTDYNTDSEDSVEILQYMRYSDKIEVIEPGDENKVGEEEFFVLTGEMPEECSGWMWTLLYERDGVYLYNCKRVN